MCVHLCLQCVLPFSFKELDHKQFHSVLGKLKTAVYFFIAFAVFADEDIVLVSQTP